MHSSLTRTLAAAATALAMVQMSPSAHAADPAAPKQAPADCAAAGPDAAPVADDPKQPLDPRDPQFAHKLAQRYRLLGQSTAREVR